MEFYSLSLPFVITASEKLGLIQKEEDVEERKSFKEIRQRLDNMQTDYKELLDRTNALWYLLEAKGKMRQEEISEFLDKYMIAYNKKTPPPYANER